MPVVIQAAFARQSSTSDGGYRISFDTHMAEEVVKVQEMREEALILIVMTQKEYDSNTSEAN